MKELFAAIALEASYLRYCKFTYQYFNKVGRDHKLCDRKMYASYMAN